MIESAKSSNLEPLHATLLFFELKRKAFFERTLILGLPRGICPEKISPALAKLVLQHPLDAHGLSDCMPRARLFSLT
jgi:hypothetical protein